MGHHVAAHLGGGDQAQSPVALGFPLGAGGGLGFL
jgi:hypothetical protein